MFMIMSIYMLNNINIPYMAWCLLLLKLVSTKDDCYYNYNINNLRNTLFSNIHNNLETGVCVEGAE